jgi:hypothetical protein
LVFAASLLCTLEEFEDNKGVIRIPKSKDRKYNDQKKKDKRRNNALQNIHIILKNQEHEPHTKSRVNSGTPER